VARGVYRKLADAAFIHCLTGILSSVALYTPWDGVFVELWCFWMILTDFRSYSIIVSSSFNSTSAKFSGATNSKASGVVTTFERRQRILDLLRERSGVKVTELAKLLNVSEGTIRNDLNVLKEAGQLTRVRGGAVAKKDHRTRIPAFADRAQLHADAKQWIARRAVNMIEDGDSILLDASSTAFYIAPLLQDFRNLTIVTNGIEVGLTLAQNPSHTIILVGGIIRPDGTSVVGHLGGKILEDLHIKIAFVSCSGFSIETGLTEVDIQEVQVKKQMIRCAERVVALIDSSKFGKVDLTSFASLEQISHVFTDSNVDPKFIEQLRRTYTAFTICGADTASSFTPCDEDGAPYKIGFANLSEQMPFAVDVRRGLEQAANDTSQVDLIVADNRLNGEIALKVADYLIAEEVDLAIEYQIDDKKGNLIIDKFHQANIPVIAVDIPMIGATFFGANNYRAGHLAGVALGNWIAETWNGSLDRLIILEEPRAGDLPATRIQGQLDGLQEIVGKLSQSKVRYLDSGNRSDVSEAHMLEALESLPDEHKLAVISFNDDAALGALAAARKLGRETDVVIVGQGADRLVRKEIRRSDSRIIGSTAYWPGKYGEKLINVALRILRGEPVPPAVYNQHIFITRDNIDEYYPVSQPSLVPELSGTAEEI